MTFRLIGSGLLFAALVGFAGPMPAVAQNKKAKDEVVGGYHKRAIGGFVVWIHDDVYVKVKDDDRKVESVLGLELKNITKAMPKPSVDLLKARVPVWVNWHLEKPLSNGRKGSAAGVYMSGPPRPTLIEGVEVRINGVHIYMLDDILKHYKDTDEPPVSELLLHEFVHAVHDHAFGFTNGKIETAYRQAMERKLYDKDLYIATNAVEFFAELSVAWMGRLNHYPHDAADLKKHDPASYKLMEEFWGKKKDAVKTAKKIDGIPETDLPLTVTWKSVAFGKQIHGPTADPKAVTGRLLVLHSWRADDPSCVSTLGKMQQLHEELAPFGLSVVSGHGYPGTGFTFGGGKTFTDSAVRDPARLRGVSFPVYLGAQSTELRDQNKLPHVAVFESDGHCVYRGSPFETELPIRIFLNRQILGATGVAKFTVPTLLPIVRSLETGALPSTVIPKLQPMWAAATGEAKDEIAALLKELLSTANSAVEAAEADIEGDPVSAWQQLDRVVNVFRGSLAAQKSAKLIDKLRANKLVAAEIRARPLLEAVKKLETVLSGKPQAFDPTLASFRADNAMLLKQLKDAIDKVKKSSPGSKGAAEAELIAERYGV